MPSSTPITIGVLAHVDAGKTSLTECILHEAGATQTLGSVDKGSAITDNLAMEKSRGISIKASTVRMTWQGQDFDIVDTPGHVDFVAEVDRALSVLDVVVLVVSAREGVQAHTLSLWEGIQERGLPALIFINKIDRSGAYLEEVFQALSHDLDTDLFALNIGDNTQYNPPKVVDFTESAAYLSNAILDSSLANLAETDDKLLEAYLDGNMGDLNSVLKQARAQIRERSLTPVVFGSAKLHLGISELLDALLLLPKANEAINETAARVFKTSFEAKLGRLAHIRSYGTPIRAKDSIWLERQQQEVKVNQVFRAKLGNFEQVEALKAGEIGAITTSEVLLAGDVLGKDKKLAHSFKPISQAVIAVQVVAEEGRNYQKLGEALTLLNIEDPTLEFQWYKNEREFHIKILGPIQTEVLKESLRERFDIIAEFLPPRVIYKETPKSTAEGFVRYWMPKPCWAIMKFLIEPIEKGSGVVFESKVGTNDISTKYQNEVRRAVPWSLRQGIKGWEVTDIKITLLEGSEHQVHSNPGDFLLATPMGIMRGLEAADTDLLEPMYSFNIKAPEDCLGAVLSDLNQMYAQLQAPELAGGFFQLSGRVSVAKAMHYSIAFNAATSGKGRLKLQVDGYEKTDASEDKQRAYKGVSPLHEAQWILHRRGAFKADDRIQD